MMDGKVVPAEEYERSTMKRPRFTTLSTTQLLAQVFPSIRWIVPGYVAEGLSILAGRQKLGKTWLGIDWAIAVACGGAAMGSIPCEQGDVLYIDLENGPRRIRSRIDILFPDERRRPDLSRLAWASEAPALNKRFLDALEDWRQTQTEPRLVIIDVLQRIKPAGNANQTSYESDYASIAGLQQWATRHGIAVVALHHTRKGGADDPLEALSGSNGLSACADTTLLLDRNGNGITLYVRGRDVEEKEAAMTFVGGLWNVTGDASDVRRSSERGNILTALDEATEPISPSELADVTGMKPGNVRRLLHSMGNAGEVRKSGRGQYESATSASQNSPN